MPSAQPSLPPTTPGASAGGMGATSGCTPALALAAAGSVAALLGLAWQGADTDAGGTGNGWLVGLVGLALTLPPLWLGWQLRRQQARLDARAQRQAHQDAQLQTMARTAALLRRAEEAAGTGSFDWNPVSGTLHWSDGHFRVWGHAPGALTPDYAAFRARIHPDDLDAMEARLQHSLQTGGRYEFTHRLCWPDGSVVDVLARGEVTLDAMGRAVRMVGTVQDITRGRRAEARPQLHGLHVDTISDLLSEVDETGAHRLGHAPKHNDDGSGPDITASLSDDAGWSGATHSVPIDGPTNQPITSPAIASTPAPAGADDPLQVLYIDDNPVNTLLMAAMFERLPGLVLQCECDPQAGLALALADPPALLLVDIQMPGIDGYEVLRRLRANPATRSVPAVAVSANAMPQDLARGRAAGFADYLTKPLELHQLQAALAAVLPGWQAAPD